MTYKIKLSARAARWIQEEPWHSGQRVEMFPDGTCILSVPAYQDLEIIPRVMALGKDAELIEPESARKEIKDWLGSLTAIYG